MLTLIGVLIVIIGFALRLNPLLVVSVAGIATGLAAGMELKAVVEAFGRAFIENRYVGIVWLERAGLKERAQGLISTLRVATTGRVLLVYLAVRQIAAALGLTSLGGHAQMVRPLLAPMAEGASESRFGALSDATRYRIRAHSAAVDNIGVFFEIDDYLTLGRFKVEFVVRRRRN